MCVCMCNKNYKLAELRDTSNEMLLGMSLSAPASLILPSALKEILLYTVMYVVTQGYFAQHLSHNQLAQHLSHNQLAVHK